MIDFREMFEIERALHSKLDAVWGPMAAEVWSHVADLIEAGRFNEAREEANRLNLKAIGTKNREWVKYYLYRAGVFGGKVVSKANAPAVSMGQYEVTLNNVADQFVAQMDEHMTEGVRDQLLQLIAAAESDWNLVHSGFTVKKADEPQRYVKGFTSFKKEADDKLKLISSLHTSRLAAWGGLAEAKTVGATKYRIVEQDDNRTCDFCALIDGKEFDVEDGNTRIREILKTKPGKLEDVAPFADTTKGFLEKMQTMTAEDLAAEGYDVPPFHPGCRGVVVPVYEDDEEDATEVPYNEPGDIEADEFDVIGQKKTPNVELWNSTIKRPPAELLESLSGIAEKKLIDGAGGEQNYFSFASDGSLKMRYEDAKSEVSYVYDPTIARLYQNFAEFKGAPNEAAHWIDGMFKRMVAAGEKLGAKEFMARAAGAQAVEAYAKMGFVPSSQKEWFDLQKDIASDLRPGGKLQYLFKDDEEKYKVVLKILDDKDPKALWALASLPEGKSLLAGRDLKVRLNLKDDEAMDLFRAGH